MWLLQRFARFDENKNCQLIAVQVRSEGRDHGLASAEGVDVAGFRGNMGTAAALHSVEGIKRTAMNGSEILAVSDDYLLSPKP